MNPNELTNEKIFKFWLPLAATWLMMSIEGPFLAAVIARLAEPKFNLAAYGVAFSFAMIVEAPIIMIMSATVALVRDRDSFIKLRTFSYALNYTITTVMLVILFTPVFDFLALEVVDLPPAVAHLTRIASIILLPWPGMIGYRRFYQGMLIINSLTRRVAYGTIIRLTSMAGTALALYFLTDLPGAWVGAAALTMGVTMEGLASRMMAYRAVKDLLANPAVSAEPPLTYRRIIHFYYPLALSTILALGAHPMVTFFLGHSRMAIESLAVMPVINSLSFIFRSPGLAMQEVVITFLGKNNEGYAPLAKFACRLGLYLTLGFLLIAFSPLAVVWFYHVSGLSQELTDFAIFPLQLISILPALAVLLSFQRAALVNAHRTKPITIATGLEMAVMIGALFLMVNYLDMIGAVAGATAYAIGRGSANIFLYRPSRAVLMKKAGDPAAFHT